MFNGVVVGTEPAAQYEARLGLEPTQVVHTSRLLIGDDGTAALEIPDTGKTAEAIAPLLGQGATPSAASLVQVTRPREHSRLPTGVRDLLDDRYIDGELDGTDAAGEPRDTPAARGLITAELQGAHAAAALARKDARKAQRAFEKTMVAKI
jgi:hypothetical protein